jgi:hypothetical protein
MVVRVHETPQQRRWTQSVTLYVRAFYFEFVAHPRCLKIQQPSEALQRSILKRLWAPTHCAYIARMKTHNLRNNDEYTELHLNLASGAAVLRKASFSPEGSFQARRVTSDNSRKWNLVETALFGYFEEQNHRSTVGNEEVGKYYIDQWVRPVEQQYFKASAQKAAPRHAG